MTPAAPVNDTPWNVLFLCTGNSARSILGEASLNNAGDSRFRAYSAGSQPTGQVHPYALELIEHLGYGIDGLRSKSWDEFSGPSAPAMHFVITVCDNAANESCPIWPGHPVTAHWGIPDPAAVRGSAGPMRQAFADAHRVLHARIKMLTALPIATFDVTSLGRRIADIGKVLE